MSGGPLPGLDGLAVLDLSDDIAGGYCAKLLAAALLVSGLHGMDRFQWPLHPVFLLRVAFDHLLSVFVGIAMNTQRSPTNITAVRQAIVVQIERIEASRHSGPPKLGGKKQETGSGYQAPQARHSGATTKIFLTLIVVLPPRY